eukprot:6214571-Pleurochrysis_carterae.AAC.3
MSRTPERQRAAATSHRCCDGHASTHLRLCTKLLTLTLPLDPGWHETSQQYELSQFFDAGHAADSYTDQSTDRWKMHTSDGRKPIACTRPHALTTSECDGRCDH